MDTNNKNEKLIYKDLSFKIIGSFIKVLLFYSRKSVLIRG